MVDLDTRLANRRAVPPIGTIVAFYDFGTDGPGGVPLTFNTATWAYCEGQTIVVGGVSRTLPDLSGRYLVGYGTDKVSATLDTDGDANLGSDAFTHNLFGTAVFMFNFVHSHDHNHVHALNSHVHSINHRHTLGAHTHNMYHIHGIGYYQHNHKWLSADGVAVYTYDSSGSQINQADAGGAETGKDGFEIDAKALVDEDFYTDREVSFSNNSSVFNGNTYPPSTDTTSDHTGDSGVAVGNTDALVAGTGATGWQTGSSLTNPVDIRPRSIKVRFIMRIA